jgi:acyl-CoA reductase-like NAD-dependent aldehyde dehydrogenase
MDIKKIKILKQLYINGKWTEGVKGKKFDVINPSDESILANISEATNEDVDIAVKSAR